MAALISILLTTDAALRRQQRAIVAPAAALRRWGLRAGSLVRVRVGRRARAVWLHVDGDAAPTAPDGTPVVRLDVRTAAVLGVAADSPVAAELDVTARNLAVQPMRLDYPQGADRVVVSPAVLAELGGPGSLAVVRSETRVLTARAWTPPPPDVQADDRIRLSYHARLLLGVSEGGSSAMQVSPWHADTGGRAGARAREGLLVARAALGAPLRAWLGAPELMLAVRSAGSIDDGQRVARCSASTLDLLGVEPGDRVRVRWGRRTTSVRIFPRATLEHPTVDGPAVVDWASGRTVDVIPDDAEVLIPAAVRAELGAPRDSILCLRRSTAWLLRKRAVSLTLPLVGVAISVPGLSLPAWAGALLLILATVMTLARDRVPNPRRRVRLDG